MMREACQEISFSFCIEEVKMSLMTCRQKIDCWCTICHTSRLQRKKDLNLSLQDVLAMFELHEQRESRTLEAVFNEVLDTTVYAKLVKDLVFRNTGYRNLKSYFKTVQPNEEDKELQKRADSINHAAKVYDGIGKIYENLQQIRDFVDIRPLSLNMLFEARNLNWCYSYAERIRGSSKRKPDELEYSEADFQNLITTVTQHQCFRAVSDDKNLVSALSHRLERELLKGARRR